MPSLRSRIEDLPLLVRDFAERNVAEGRSRVELGSRALRVLSRHTWPGNIRELGNLIERLSILCPNRRVELADLPAKYRPSEVLVDLDLDLNMEPELSPLGLADLPLDIDMEESVHLDDSEAVALLVRSDSAEVTHLLPPEGLDLRQHLFNIERDLIQQALLRTGGTVAHAARLLKLRRTTLVEKLRKFEMLNETAAEV
jgi:sigma-54 specific flagellar transcriptional regulator A